MDNLASQLIAAIQSEDLDHASVVLTALLAETATKLQHAAPQEAERHVASILEALNRSLLLARGVRSQIGAKLQRAIGESSYYGYTPESHTIGLIA